VATNVVQQGRLGRVPLIVGLRLTA
jgi:hypothetical protein